MLMEEYFYNAYFDAEKNHWLMRVRRLIVLDILKKYLSEAGMGAKILDFGCGSGYFVSELEKLGYKSYGIDASEKAIRFGKESGVKNIEIAKTEKLEFLDNYFDAALCLDVLEHLKDESVALREIKRVLKRSGVLIIMVPAFNFLWGAQDEVSHHYRRYTLKLLLNVVKEAGDFTVLRKTYFNAFLFLPIAAVRLLSRALKISGRKSDFDINNAFFNKLFFWIFTLERRFLLFMNFCFGVSILVVLRKK